MKIRWLKQKDDFSCVPTAVINVLKWLGVRATRADLIKFREKCGTTRKGGSNFDDYDKMFRRYSGKLIKKITMPQIDEALDQNKLIVLLAQWNDCHNKHMLIIAKRTERSYFLVNVYDGHRWLSRKLTRRFYLGRIGVYPGAYIIPRKNTHRPCR